MAKMTTKIPIKKGMIIKPIFDSSNKMSNSHLVAVLRPAIRMMRFRGYDFYEDDRKDMYEHLTNPDLNVDAYINFIAGPDSDSVKYRLGKDDLRATLYRKIYANAKAPKSRMLMSNIFVKTDPEDASKKLYSLLYFANVPDSGKTMSKSELELFLSILDEHRAVLSSGVFVTPCPLNSAAADTFNATQHLSMTHFTDEEIMFDPTAHVCSAEMTVLTRAQKVEFLRRNPHVRESQMPKIYANEPTIKYIGATVDDIVCYDVESFIGETLVSVEPFHRAVRRPLEKKKKTK